MFVLSHCSSGMRVEQFHDSVEILIVVEVDGEGSFASAGTFDFDIGLKGLPQLRLCGAVGGGQFGFGREGGLGRLFVGFDQLLGLVDREVTVDNVVEDGKMPFGIVDIDKCTGMGHAYLSGAEGQLGLSGKVEQTEVVGDGGAVFADALAELLVGELALLYKGVVGEGYLHGVEVFALDVLHQCHFHHLAVGGYTDVGGEFGKACELGGTETTLTGDELIFVIGHTPNGNGSDDALFTDGLGQFLECGVVELFARLKGVGFNVADGNHADGGGDIGCSAIEAVDIDVAENGVQPTAGDKGFLTCHCVLSALMCCVECWCYFVVGNPRQVVGI